MKKKHQSLTKSVVNVYEGESFHAVYAEILRDLCHDPEYVTSPRGISINEMRDVFVRVHDPLQCTFENNRRSTPLRYLAGELLWYFSGRNDAGFIRNYSKFWDNIKNPDGTCNSAYGHQLWSVENEHGFTEWDWAKRALTNDVDSRQSIVRFNKPVHSFSNNRDFVCTLNGVFQIRDNVLNLCITMRSSDIVKGLTFDFPFFSLMLQTMRLELLQKYPDLGIGSLTMLLNSSHLYETDFELAHDMLLGEFVTGDFPSATESLIGLSVDDILSAGDPLSNWIQRHA